MSVLAIDTSSRHRCVCVLTDAGGEPLRSELVRGEPVDAALPVLMARLLGGELGAVMVVDGPGSYTGVRAGMAAALGLAHSRGIALHCAGALEVIAAGADAHGEPFWACSDAGRGAVYLARGDHVLADPHTTARRTLLSGLDLEALPVFSADALPINGLRAVDPALALTRAVPAALARAPADVRRLRAVYVT